MGRPRSVEQFEHYLAVCQQRGIAVKEAHIDGARFVLKFADSAEAVTSGGSVEPVDLIQWSKRR